MAWTEEQLRAINLRSSNLLLSAAAGSGKTTVLVERILSLIQEGADVRRMLVVTFTRAAAADMRAKLSRALRARADENQRFREQAMYLEQASISTLHAFCADFLRANFEAAQVDPAFRILDDEEDKRLLDQSLDEALEKAYAAGGQDLEDLDYARGPAGVRRAAAALYRFLQDRPDPEAWLADAVDIDRHIDLWTRELEESARSSLRLALIAVRSALSLPECPENYAKALTIDEQALQELIAMEGYEDLRNAVSAYRLQRPTGRSGRTEEEMKRVKKLRQDASNRIKAAVETLMPLADAVEDVQRQKGQLICLTGIVRDVTRLQEEARRDASALTYSDLEHVTLRALQEERTRESLREQYDYIFVDEYQDTSDVQEALVNLIRREDNLFMVGDVKQSIYRFRAAEPRLFLEKYARYGAGDGGQLIPLTRNFRSLSPILEFTNLVFRQVMTGGMAEIEYDSLAYLRPGSDEQLGGPPVEVHIIESTEGDEESAREEEDLEQAEGAEREGVLIAQKILELMREDPTLRYRDIAILSRSKTSAFQAILPMLAAYGIPAFADGAAGYFDTVEVSLAMTLLQLTANRRNDIALIGALRSPVAGLTNEELAEVRLSFPNMPFSDAAQAYAAGADEKAQRLRGFFTLLDSWRMRKGALPLHQLVRCVLDESGLYTYAGALPGGLQRQANLDQLVTRANRFYRDVSGSLTRFLGTLEDMRSRGEGDAAHPLGENDDVVRLMSVHHSKGLEFRVVFGARLSTRYHVPKNEDTLLADRDLGIGLIYTDPELGTRRPTLARRAIALQERRRDFAEEMRILYVLLTRAREKLILTGSVTRRETAEAKWALVHESPGAASCHLDLIMGALEDSSAADTQIILAFHRPEEFTYALQESSDSEFKALLDEAFTAELPGARNRYYEDLTWMYPDPETGKKPLKLTASGLLREIEGPEQIPAIAPRPAFLMETGMTATERGSAYHRALQNVNLAALDGLEGAALTAAIAEEMRGMLDNGRLFQAEYEAVRPHRLASFLGSPLGLRLRASREVHREWAFNVLMRAGDALTPEEAFGFGDAELIVQGSIDCCFMEDGEWVLLDYKTDRSNDLDALTAHYEKQLRVYALALEKITGRRVKEKLLCLLSSGIELQII